MTILSLPCKRVTLEHLGFEREGYAKAYLNIGGRWQDHVLTALVSKVYIDPDQYWARQLS